LLLRVATDLHQRHMSEPPGGLELMYSGDVSLDVGTERHLRRDVFLATVLDAASNSAGTGARRSLSSCR
jgi:hypothetical protein